MIEPIMPTNVSYEITNIDDLTVVIIHCTETDQKRCILKTSLVNPQRLKEYMHSELPNKYTPKITTIDGERVELFSFESIQELIFDSYIFILASLLNQVIVDTKLPEPRFLPLHLILELSAFLTDSTSEDHWHFQRLINLVNTITALKEINACDLMVNMSVHQSGIPKLIFCNTATNIKLDVFKFQEWYPKLGIVDILL